jgi:MoxR-like ATPase
MAQNNDLAIKAMAVAIQTPGLGITVRGKKKRMLGLPVLLWGPPGVAKTAFVQQLADKLGFHLITVLASLREPSDFLGLPIPASSPEASAKAGLPPNVMQGVTGSLAPATNLNFRAAALDQVQYAPPDWALECNANSDNPDRSEVGEGKRVLLFLDEFATAPKGVQAALLRVVHERVVGDLQLNSNVAVIAAANPPSMSPGGSDLDAPTVNRFIHLDWYPPSKKQWSDFIKGAGGSVPPLPVWGDDRSGRLRGLLGAVLSATDDAEEATAQAAFLKQLSRMRLPGNARFMDIYNGSGGNSIANLAADFIMNTKGLPGATLQMAAANIADGEATYPMYQSFEPLFAMPTTAAFAKLQNADPFVASNLAWASPRSWEIALRAGAGVYACGVDGDEFNNLFKTIMCGTLGVAVCDAFTEYIGANIDEKKTPEELLADPALFLEHSERQGGGRKWTIDTSVLAEMLNYGLAHPDDFGAVMHWLGITSDGIAGAQGWGSGHANSVLLDGWMAWETGSDISGATETQKARMRAEWRKFYAPYATQEADDENLL